MRDELERIPEDGSEPLLNVLYNTLMKKAKKGNIMAIRELLDRAYGKPSQAQSENENQVVEVRLIAGEELIEWYIISGAF